jgi:hypothetical protein
LFTLICVSLMVHVTEMAFAILAEQMVAPDLKRTKAAA